MPIDTRTLLNGLRSAALRDQLEVHYQPIILLRTGRLMGYEALLRWSHPTEGMISPDIFITFAEQHHMMFEITKILFEKVLTEQAHWNHSVQTMISLNISPSSLPEDDLSTLLEPLTSTDTINRKQVILEITETAIFENPVSSGALIHRLKSEGFTFALDDFGTGYSSLTNLRDLPFRELKIDKSFIQNLDEQHSNDHILIDAILSIAHAFGAIVVAEGIETKKNLLQLKSMNCYAGQGFLFAKPMPASDIEGWYEQWPVQWRQLAHQASHAMI